MTSLAMVPTPCDIASQLEQAKLNAMKELAYGASHEINNPLANISARAQALLRDETDPDRRRTLQAIDAQALRAHEMISDLMLFARPPQLQTVDCDVRELVDDVVAKGRVAAGDVEIEITPPAAGPPVIAQVDPAQLAVAIDALIRNAMEALGPSGRVAVNVHRCGKAGVRITVTDNGPGIAPEVRDHLFDPFYSGREAGRGLGFGLSKCWRIVQEHGGAIDVESPGGQGAAFIIRIGGD